MRRQSFVRRLLIAVLLLVSLSCARRDPFDRVRSVIREQLHPFQVPSISVAVARDGKILWEEGFGWADREHSIPATGHTMYSLASISKPMTATALMVLKERGKIDLDRPINDYLGEAKVVARVGKAENATVRRVASHSSGLPLHYQFFYEDEPWHKPPMDETIRRYANLVTAPGERYQYSNLGYGILDYVISRVSGASYADFMRDQVFLPLNLTHTSVNLAPGLERCQAIRYGPDGAPIPFYDFDHCGASAIYSSAHDLVRFGMFHLKAHLPDQKPILSDSSIDEMQKPAVETGKDHGYGIGWGTQITGTGYRIVSHTGGMGGVATVLQLVPAKKIAVVVLANSNSVAPYRISREILAAVAPELFGKAPPPQRKPKEKFQPAPDLTGNWAGSVHTYQGDRPVWLRIQPSGDVRVRIGSGAETVLRDPAMNYGYLRGYTNGDLGTADVNRRPYVIEFSLKPRGDVLNGAMTAISKPDRRAGNALSHWVELKRGAGAD